MKLSLIAAVGKNGEIGKNNALLWHLDGDLPFFKHVTMGKPVIMGSNTFRSLPKALPGRTNIVITSHPEAFQDAGVVAVDSVEKALNEVRDCEEAFVIGGGRVYSQFIAIADCLYLTEADAEDCEADTYFPAFNKENYIATLIDEGGTQIHYRHMVYEMKAGSFCASRISR